MYTKPPNHTKERGILMKTNIIVNSIRIHQGLLPVNGTWHGGKQGDLPEGGTWHGGKQGDLPEGGTWHCGK